MKLEVSRRRFMQLAGALSSVWARDLEPRNPQNSPCKLAYPIFCTGWIVSVALLLMYLIGPAFLYQA
jgi:hypothetical protein